MAILGNSGDTIKTAMTTAFGEIKGDSLDYISAALPYALAIVGAVLTITIGIKVFKKITGKA